MKNIFKYLFLLLTTSAMGQNLVPNPSFEDTVVCPDHGGNIDQAAGWINCGFSPDYYNACANSSFPILGVPNSFYSGFQYAFDGIAYAGFATYQSPFVAHEFIGVQLIQSLNPGTKYYASCVISMANNYDCAVNNFGFRFFMSMPFDDINTAPIDNFSHIHSNVIITDTLNWTKIAGSFIADSAYQYLVIGNFYDNVNTSIMGCDTLNGDLSYYLIDAVCVSTDSLTCYNWTGIKENDQSEFGLFPNPVNDVLHIKGLNEDAQYCIINSMGEVVKENRVGRSRAEINLKSFSDGLYFISINNKRFKFLIIH